MIAVVCRMECTYGLQEEHRPVYTLSWPCFAMLVVDSDATAADRARGR